MNTQRWNQMKAIFHAALELRAEERQAFLVQECKGDVELLRSVAELLDAHHNAGSFLISPAVMDAGLITVIDQVRNDKSSDLVGQRIGPYEIIREIGHGGMGTVLLAVRTDDEFRKQVALKVINRGMDTDTLLRRFMMERQILANLEHANIARLLEGGSTSDGLPYFVMEYVEGEPIDRYCDLHSLSTVERLLLFRQVCDALQCAHQNLVVHRDIKPSNILVTAEGVPKLLDFGIAKLLSPNWDADPAEITASMQILMTPAYASPEQLRGLAITTASDIYSLGVILYELLSGQRPYQFESRRPEELIEVILHQEPEKPSTAANNASTNQGRLSYPTTAPSSTGRVAPIASHNAKLLRGDLDNIVLKALRKEPQRRYQSVQDLSEDIRRHLEGLPVSASPDTFRYRSGKFVQRNKTAVLATVAVLITLLSATVLTSWQARVARRERDNSELRFRQVRKLAHSVLFDYHDGIENLPGATPMREKMVTDALEYLDNLSAASSSDTSLQREVATAYERVGDVQGSPNRSNLGNYKGSLSSQRKAMGLREQLHSAALHDEQVSLELARSYGAVGELLQVTGDLTSALDHYGKAFAIFNLLTSTTNDTRRELSILDDRYGKALAATGKLDEAVKTFQNGIAIAQELSNSGQSDSRLARAEAFAHIHLADAYADMGQLKEALANNRTAVRLLEPLVQQTNAQSRRDIAVADVRVADVLAKMGDKKAALEIELKALTEDEEAFKIDPTNALVRRDVYIDHYKIAVMAEAISDLKSAIAHQLNCIALVEEAVSLNPVSSVSRADLGVAHFRFGEMLEKKGDLTGALQHFTKATDIEEGMSNADPANTVARGDLSEDLMKVSDVTLILGDREKALAGYQRALAIREDLVAKTPNDVEGRSQLGRIYESLGDCLYTAMKSDRRGVDYEGAQRWYKQSLDVWTNLQHDGTLPPDYAKKPDEVSKKIASCEPGLRS